MANTKVTGDLIASSTIATGNIADNAVTSDKISGITTAHITEGSNLYYTDARADARVALVVDSAPSTLNTLNELADALGDDPNFATTTATNIGTKLPLAGGTLTGGLTGTTAGFSGSITASGNSNSFGNTTIAALSASTGTFSASVTAAGNSNSFGNTNFTGIITVSSGNVQLVDSNKRITVDGSDIRIWQRSAANIQFLTNDLERMRIDSSGNVQIPEFLRVGPNINNANTFDYSLQTRQLLVAGFSGTGASNLYLHRDDATIAGANELGNINFSGQDSGSYVGAQIQGLSAGSWSTNSCPGQLVFRTAPNGSTTLEERMRIHKDGNVLINSGVYLSWGTNGAASIEGSTVSNKLQFRTNSADAMIIDSSQNVGIGTTSPAAKLHIVDTTTMTSGQSSVEVLKLQRIDSGGDIKASTEGHISMWATDANNNNEWARISWLNSDSSDSGLENRGALSFWTSGGGTLDRAMYIDHNQNVGIGTTSPTEKLHVEGRIRLGSTPVICSHDNVGIDIDQNNNSGSNYFRVTRDGEVTELFRVQENGNVGIGTTSPGAKLQINNTGSGQFAGGNSSSAGSSHLMLTDYGSTSRTLMSGPSIVFQTPASSDGTNIWATSRLLGSPAAAGSARGTFSIQVRDLYDPLSDGTSWNWRTCLTAINTGNVGIGTTSPAGILQVVNTGVSQLILGYNGGSTNFFDGDTQNFRNAAGTNMMSIGSTGRINMYGLDAKGTTGSDVRYLTSTEELYYLTSSKRYKTNIVNLESTLDKINVLRPVRFKDIKTGEDACGLIAEETFEIIPDVVFTKQIEGFDEPQIEGINYSDLVPFLIKSIQELKAEIDELKTQINS